MQSQGLVNHCLEHWRIRGSEESRISRRTILLRHTLQLISDTLLPLWVASEFPEQVSQSRACGICSVSAS